MDQTTLPLVTGRFLSALQDMLESQGYPSGQIVVMDVTAGAYLVANPSEGLPRIICSVDPSLTLRVELSELVTPNYVVQELTKTVQSFNFPGKTWVLEDPFSGVVLDEDDAPLEPASVEKLLKESFKTVEELKLTLEYEVVEDVATSGRVVPEEEDLNDETKEIIAFINTRASRSIQSRHLRSVFPKWSKKKCTDRLREMEEQGLVLRGGSWYMLRSKATTGEPDEFVPKQ